MRARSDTDVASIPQALAILGLTGSTTGLADEAALAAAFRAAIKAARPGLPGGDEEQFRRVIAAYRLIQAKGPARPALAAPALAPRRAAAPVVSLTPRQALVGAVTEVALTGGRRLRLDIPPGLRSGEHLRLRGGARDGSDLYLPVLIRAAEGLRVLGDDLYMDWPVSPRLLEDGGRVEVDTHAGMRSAWVTPGLHNLEAAPARLRLRNLGLPARGRRRLGHLFVTLVPSAEVPSAAEDLLARFTRVWTPERLAA